MDSKTLYNQAYELQYTKQNYVEALNIYLQIIKQFPQSLESSLAKDQIKKINPETDIENINLEDKNQNRIINGSLQTTTTEKNEDTQTNSISEIIKIIGFIEIIAGVFLGLFVGSQFREFSWLLALPWWAISFIAGMLLIGFSEVIRLLHEINEQMKTSEINP